MLNSLVECFLSSDLTLDCERDLLLGERFHFGGELGIAGHLGFVHLLCGKIGCDLLLFVFCLDCERRRISVRCDCAWEEADCELDELDLVFGVGDELRELHSKFWVLGILGDRNALDEEWWVSETSGDLDLWKESWGVNGNILIDVVRASGCPCCGALVEVVDVSVCCTGVLECFWGDSALLVQFDVGVDDRFSFWGVEYELAVLDDV